MLQSISDNAGPVGAHPIPVEAEWAGGLIQVGHNTRYIEVLRKKWWGRRREISGTQRPSHCNKKPSMTDILSKATADLGGLRH